VPERLHLCHWPDCGKRVPAKLWGCLEHWKRVPKSLQMQLQRAYRKGQELTKSPSPEYVRVAQLIQDWISETQRSLKV